MAAFKISPDIAFEWWRQCGGPMCTVRTLRELLTQKGYEADSELLRDWHTRYRWQDKFVERQKEHRNRVDAFVMQTMAGGDRVDQRAASAIDALLCAVIQMVGQAMATLETMNEATPADALRITDMAAKTLTKAVAARIKLLEAAPHLARDVSGKAQDGEAPEPRAIDVIPQLEESIKAFSRIRKAAVTVN